MSVLFVVYRLLSILDPIYSVTNALRYRFKNKENIHRNHVLKRSGSETNYNREGANTRRRCSLGKGKNKQTLSFLTQCYLQQPRRNLGNKGDLTNVGAI